MKIEFNEKKFNKIIEKKLKKKYKKTLKSSKQLNLMFNSAFMLADQMNLSDTKGTVTDLKEDIKIFIMLVSDSLKGKYQKVPKKTLFLMGFAVYYFVYPIDVVSDFLPVIGFGDDISLFLAVFSQVAAEIEEYKEYLKSNDININNQLIIYQQNDGINYGEELANLSVEEELITEQVIDDTKDSFEQMITDNKAIAVIENDNQLIVSDEYGLNNSLSSLDNFFTYTHKDYSRIIYNILYNSDEEIVELKTKTIKKHVLLPQNFDYDVCVETMINNQIFDMMEKEIKTTKPYKKIINSDKKTSLNGKYYITTYEVNPDISDYFNSMFNWELIEMSQLGNGNALINYQLNNQWDFTKEQLESLIDHIVEYYEDINGIIIYNIEVNQEIISIVIDKHKEQKCKIHSSNQQLIKYNEIFDYLELNLIKIIKSRIAKTDDFNLVKKDTLFLKK